MLPKKERLSREAFNRFFSLGKRLHSPSLQMVWCAYPKLHVSVVVSKKIAKKAVSRNKIRRRIYDIVRNYRSERTIQGVFIFIAKAGLETKTFAAIKEEVRADIDRVLKINQQ